MYMCIMCFTTHGTRILCTDRPTSQCLSSSLFLVRPRSVWLQRILELLQEVLLWWNHWPRLCPWSGLVDILGKILDLPLFAGGLVFLILIHNSLVACGHPVHRFLGVEPCASTTFSLAISRLRWQCAS